MKFSKAIFAVVTGVALSGAAMAQDNAAVSAEKTTGIKSLIPTLYGNVQVRHYTLRKMEKDKVASETPMLEVRPNIGFTMFNDKVDQSFLWAFQKKTDTVTVDKAFLVSITQWKVLEGAAGYIGPYAETYQSNGVSFNESYVGLYGEAAKDVATLGIGTVSVSGWGQWNALLKSGKEADNTKVTPENRTGRQTFSLNSDGDTTMAQRDPTWIALQAVQVKLKPAAVPGFSVGTEVEYDLQWDPKYAAKDVDGDTRTELDGYKTQAMTITKFILGYKLTDAVSLSNSLRHKTVGFYGEGLDVSDSALSSSRFENRLILSATLF